MVWVGRRELEQGGGREREREKGRGRRGEGEWGDRRGRRGEGEWEMGEGEGERESGRWERGKKGRWEMGKGRGGGGCWAVWVALAQVQQRGGRGTGYIVHMDFQYSISPIDFTASVTTGCLAGKFHKTIYGHLFHSQGSILH